MSNQDSSPSTLPVIRLIPAALTCRARRTRSADDSVTGWKGLLDFRNNPLPWVGVVLLVTIGAGSVAGSVRLGRAKLSASLGQG